MEKKDVLSLVACLAIVYLTAFIGSIFTIGNVDSSWYESIKPSITPPNYVFPIVWNILFFLIALSLFFSWIHAKQKEKKKVALVFGINLFLNALWNLLYFGMQRVGLAFIDLIGIWISIILIMVVVWKIDKKAVYLLIPYLLWVSFAGVLNYLSLG